MEGWRGDGGRESRHKVYIHTCSMLIQYIVVQENNDRCNLINCVSCVLSDQ